MTIVGDNPIREPSEDRLGRAALAASFARQIPNPSTATPVSVSQDRVPEVDGDVDDMRVGVV